MRGRVAITVVLFVVASSCTSGGPAPGGVEGGSVPDSRLLPAPLELSGSPGERARLLARRVLDGGEEGTAALLAALSTAGIAVRDPSLGGQIVVPAAGPSQGIAVQAADVIAMMRLEERGYQATLADVGALLRMPGLGLERAPVERLLASAIADHAERGEPPLRPWAAFLIELGRQGPAGYDLGAVRHPARVPLGGVQTFLILLRLFADAYTIGNGSPGGASGALGAAVPGLLAAGPGLGSALPASGDLPCTLSDAEAFVLDRAAVVSSTGFGQLWEKANLPGASLLGLAGAALPVLRFLAIQAILDPRIELVPAPPLVRTKKTNVDGATHELRATIRMSTGRFQMLNCFRIMLTAAGLDFSLPNDGPVEGAEVLWRCVSGCTVGQPVQLCALPCSGVGGIQSGDPTRNAYETRTGDDGVARTGIQGRRQKQELGDWALEVRKEARVAITVKLTTPDLVNDLVSVGETVAGGAIGGVGGVLPGFIVDLLDRFGVRGATYPFPVVDWELPGYRVRLSKGPATYEGEKCDGPAGLWEITARATIAGVGMIGSFRAELDEHTLRGPALITWRSSSGGLQITMRGRARFVQGDPPTLAFDYQGGQAFLPGRILTLIPGAHEEFPLEVGRCEVVEVEG